MTYCIVTGSGCELPDEFDRDYRSPIEVLHVLSKLRSVSDQQVFVILRDGNEISEVDLSKDIDSYEALSLFEAENVLRSVFRPAYRGQPDLANGPYGVTAVWKPVNPEDRFE
jgi:hypothetical protein